MILVDRFDIIMPKGVGKEIKKRSYTGLVFITCACINPEIEFQF